MPGGASGDGISRRQGGASICRRWFLSRSAPSPRRSRRVWGYRRAWGWCSASGRRPTPLAPSGADGWAEPRLQPNAIRCGNRSPSGGRSPTTTGPTPPGTASATPGSRRGRLKFFCCSVRCRGMTQALPEHSRRPSAMRAQTSHSCIAHTAGGPGPGRSACLARSYVPASFCSRYWPVPLTVNSSPPDSIPPSSVQMAPWASQSVVAFRAMVTSPLESGLTVISQRMLPGRSSRRT